MPRRAGPIAAFARQWRRQADATPYHKPSCSAPRRAISRHLQDNGGDGQMTPLLRLAAGAGAGIVGMSATYPLDMVRGRLTVQGERKTSQYRGIWDCTRQIVKQACPRLVRTRLCGAAGKALTAERSCVSPALRLQCQGSACGRLGAQPFQKLRRQGVLT